MQEKATRGKCSLASDVPLRRLDGSVPEQKADLFEFAATDPNQMLIQVIDNGPGVADQERIFDAFVATKTNGMGIGLAVSRSIVEAHGGRLWAENNPAGGATFNVALPVFPVIQTFDVS